MREKTAIIKKSSDFSAMIKERRKSVKITQADLSGVTGVSQPNLSLIESGKISPNLGTCLRICQALGIDINCIAR